MTQSPRDDRSPDDLPDDGLSDDELRIWLAEHPELAADLELARRVRRLVAQLRAAELVVPEGFELRLMARVQQDAALRNLLDLGLNGVGSLLMELIALIVGLLPAAPAPSRA
jgi:hypothetical protein